MFPEPGFDFGWFRMNTTRASSNRRSWTRQASFMWSGLPSIAAEVVSSRKTLIWVKRVKAICVSAASHQDRAALR